MSLPLFVYQACCPDDEQHAPVELLEYAMNPEEKRRVYKQTQLFILRLWKNFVLTRYGQRISNRLRLTNCR